MACLSRVASIAQMDRHSWAIRAVVSASNNSYGYDERMNEATLAGIAVIMHLQSHVAISRLHAISRWGTLVF